MDTLIRNITGIYGEKGQEWFNNLPQIINFLCNHWQLTQLKPVSNMTYNYVAKAISKLNQSVVLKISCDEKTIIDEKEALKHFAGSGAIQLIDYQDQYFAMLLEQAVPGVSLKTYYPQQMDIVINCYLQTAIRLHLKKLPTHFHFKHISEWLKSIDNCHSDHIPKKLLYEAKILKNKLLASSHQQVLLHGDLHHDNVLQHGNEWLAIDPKGIIGEPEFEFAAFDFIHDSELNDNKNIQQLFDERLQLMAKKAQYNIQRIRDWVFIRLVLAAAWCIEDNGDPSWNINLATRLFPY